MKVTVRKLLKSTEFKLVSFYIIIGLVYFYILPNDGCPRTKKEAVQILRRELPDDVLIGLRNMDQSELGALHFSLGLHIRNKFKASQNLRLQLSCGRLALKHYDYVSGIIILNLWKDLREEIKGQQGDLKI